MKLVWPMMRCVHLQPLWRWRVTNVHLRFSDCTMSSWPANCARRRRISRWRSSNRNCYSCSDTGRYRPTTVLLAFRIHRSHVCNAITSLTFGRQAIWHPACPVNRRVALAVWFGWYFELSVFFHNRVCIYYCDFVWTGKNETRSSAET